MLELAFNVFWCLMGCPVFAMVSSRADKSIMTVLCVSVLSTMFIMLITTQMMVCLRLVDMMFPVSVELGHFMAAPVMSGIIDTWVMEMLGTRLISLLVLIRIVALIELRLLMHGLVGFGGVCVIVRVRVIESLVDSLLMEMYGVNVVLVIVGMVKAAVSRVVGRKMRVVVSIAVMSWHMLFHDRINVSSLFVMGSLMCLVSWRVGVHSLPVVWSQMAFGMLVVTLGVVWLMGLFLLMMWCVMKVSATIKTIMVTLITDVTALHELSIMFDLLVMALTNDMVRFHAVMIARELIGFIVRHHTLMVVMWLDSMTATAHMSILMQKLVMCRLTVSNQIAFVLTRVKLCLMEALILLFIDRLFLFRLFLTFLLEFSNRYALVLFIIDLFNKLLVYTV